MRRRRYAVAALILVATLPACSGGGPLAPSPQPQVGGGCRIVYHPETTRIEYVEVVPGVVRPIQIVVPAWTETICP